MANRHKARQSALEILYAWHSGGQDSAAIPALLADRLGEEGRSDQDEAYLREMVHGVVAQSGDIDRRISEGVRGRSLKSIAHIEHNVLRLAIWEMINRLEIPYRVIINEALELARTYADEPGRGFINGVLDSLARELRREEVLESQRTQRAPKR
ncbi:MAG: transcription antitermination factor NusB [Mariprofundaceae bacterium]|nr:transcription antitermination factor NusB [Mariprofundaceae bacterium]